MSFQLSPHAVIFDLERQIERKQTEIEGLMLQIQEVPEPIRETEIRRVRNRQNFFEDRQVSFTVNEREISVINVSNNTINRQIQTLQIEIEGLKDQIPILEADISGKIELGQTVTPLDLSNLENLIANLSSQVMTPQTDKKDNTGLIIAAIIAGALIL